MHALFDMDCYASWWLSSIFFFFLCSSRVDYCYARDTLKYGKWICDNGTTLVSSGGRFELGFFTPINSSSHGKYVGIWYKQDQQTVVWVANGDSPVPNGSTGVFGIAKDGNLKVWDNTSGKNIYRWVAYTSGGFNLPDQPAYGYLHSSSKNRTVKLMDSGNLVVSDDDDQSGTSLWESFKHPTDTVLPGMKISRFQSLTSWKSDGDPGSGQFTFRRDQAEGYYFIRKGLRRDYWRSSWIPGSSDEMPDEVENLLSNWSNSGNHSYERLVMNYTGELQYYRSSGVEQGDWSLIWRKPDDNCSIYNFCGSFGSCNINNWPFVCKCLPGFHPRNPRNWNSREFLDGCTRNSTALDDDKFLSLKMMKVSDSTYSFYTDNETECKNECLNNSQCQAYSSRNLSSYNYCMIWSCTGDFVSNLQEEYTTGLNLSIRVAKSVIESTPRNCEPCGSNLIPYPLSTKINCGDRMYSGFYCNDSTGQVSFKMLNHDTYQVTSINPSTRKFVIQVKHVGDEINSTGILGHNKSFPFTVTTDYSNHSPEVKDEIEIISWDIPLEPSCNSFKDCEEWPNSTCSSTKDHEEKRCLCTENFQWNGTNLNCTKEGAQSAEEKMSLTLIVMIPLIVVFLLASAIICIYMRRRKIAKRQENQRNRALRGLDNEKHVKDLIDSVEFTEEDKKDIDVPFFDLESILAATNSFSDANKLGEGGYGPVYKGTFSGGQQIALKRLSCISRQGLQEFKNEVVLIAKLQHRNLVSLQGYCVKGYEKILLYEYMPNKSLDSFIFDQKLSVSLDWEMRFKIILGIARGLVYLHHGSRLRIIHRDLKTSNILLDEEMNPKISDFGLARMIEGKETEANTTRVVGTYGYMSPEYLLHGLFSVKSDVFSFGVVLLEIISGKKNTGFYRSELAKSLIAYAWRLWVENHVLDLMDSALEVCNVDQFVKCVNVGLLCIQEDPDDRPTMSNVVVMLISEAATVPTPKQPAFVPWRGHPITASSSSQPEFTNSLGGR